MLFLLGFVNSNVSVQTLNIQQLAVHYFQMQYPSEWVLTVVEDNTSINGAAVWNFRDALHPHMPEYHMYFPFIGVPFQDNLPKHHKGNNKLISEHSVSIVKSIIMYEHYTPTSSQNRIVM